MLPATDKSFLVGSVSEIGTQFGEWGVTPGAIYGKQRMWRGRGSHRESGKYHVQCATVAHVCDSNCLTPVPRLPSVRILSACTSEIDAVCA